MNEKAGRVRLSADELEAGLSRWAQRSADSRGRERPEEPCTLRTPYQRDRGRIVHCKSFRRLEHKTQVFIAPEGDHYRTRLTHTLEVAGIARSIARALRLNEDLTEAIALGHDLGHTPFGHAGEKVMREILEELGAGVFKHNEQSARVVEVVENDGRGLNLTWEVRDGIRHHTGDQKPVTLEGQIVRFADRIAYINHDIDDALRAELITPADLPQEPLGLLGGTGGDRIDVLVHDLVDTSYETGTIIQSTAIAKAMNELRDFLFQTVYPQSLERAGERRVRHVITNLMQYFLEHPEEMGQEPGVAASREDAAAGGHPVTAAPEEAGERAGVANLAACREWPAGRVQAVTDYISGMTDRYAISRYRELFEPRSWAAT
jgi:dGTPase